MSSTSSIVISKRLVMINSASSVLSRLLSVTVLIWLYQYLLKRIPTEEFAVYPVVMAIMVFAPVFFTVFTGGLGRYVIDAYARSDFRQVTATVSSIMPLIAAAAAVFLAGGLIFAMNIDKVLVIPPQMVADARVMMALLVISFSLQTLLSPFGLGYHIRQRFVELNLLQVAREILRIVMLLVFLKGIGPAVFWVVVANVAAELAYTTVTILRSRQMVPELRFERALVDLQAAWPLTSFGLWTTLGQLGGLMYTNAATILLNLYGTAIDVTCYFLGATLYRQITTLIQYAIMPLQPAIIAMNATDDRALLKSTVLRGGRYGLWASMLVATPAIIYADIFVDLYVGETFRLAAPVIILFMVVFPFSESNSLLPMTAIAMARVREFYLAAFIVQLLGLGLMLLFAIRLDMGAIGMTLALTITTIGAQIFYFWALCLNMIGAQFLEFVRHVIVPGLLPALGGALAWTLLRLVLEIDSWFLLLAAGFVGAVAYLAILVAFAMEPDGRRALLARVGARQ